jgi:exosortase
MTSVSEPTKLTHKSTFSSGLAFAALFALSLILWFRPLWNTFALAVANDEYTQILLILPITAMLLFRSWRREEVQFWSPATGFLVLSLLMAVMARWRVPSAGSDLILALQMVALVLWWIASFLFCFGWTVLQRFRFPLLFLLWMIPIPTLALNPIVAGLQRGSAIATRWLFVIFGVPVLRQGTLLQIPGLELQVAAECSSIRSSLMLLVTTMVLAHLLLESPWRKLFVVLLAIPLSVAKNAVRIFVIGTLGTRVDPSFLTGHLHRQGGIVFFLLALGVILLCIAILRRDEATRELFNSRGVVKSSSIT